MPKSKTKLNFDPQKITEKLLKELQKRPKDVLIHRYGLNEKVKRKTLESIGKQYGITRERVRQIEKMAIESIKKSESFKKEEKKFENLKELAHQLGGIISEEEFLGHISDDMAIQNHVHLHLHLSDDFRKTKEDDHFKDRWSVNHDLADVVHDSLKKLYSKMNDDDIVAEHDLIEDFLEHLKEVNDEYKDKEVVKRWLTLSKMLDKNPFGEWGRSHSSRIQAKSIKDYAYLILRKHGKPMHFKDVATEISRHFKKEANQATCHNELIKDDRFVLVGRGLYGLAEWGHRKGIARDIIAEILREEGPLSKEDVVEKVSAERELKKNTILVNLQNSKYFKKNKNGLYTLV